MSRALLRSLLVLVVLRMAAVPFSDEERALAQIMQGEASCQFMYEDTWQCLPAYCVGWVARNRLASGQYGASYQELQGFNGTIFGDPKWHYLAMARLVINGQGDPTGGALFVLSQQDVDKLGFDGQEASLVLRASEHRALYFFKGWPLSADSGNGLNGSADEE